MVKKIAYAIARESTDDKTLQNQYEALHAIAKSYGYEIVKEFGENVSGDVTKNDGQDSTFIVELRNAIREKKPDAIFCYWIDRLTRTTYKQGAYLNEFSVVPKIPICFTRKKRWTIDPETGIIDNQFLAELASDTTPQKERENIVARTTPMREKIAKEGFFIGHLSDGYTVKEEWGTWDDGRRRKFKYIIVDEDRRNVIERIFSLFLQGNTTSRIAEILNADGVACTNKYRAEHQEKFGYKSFYRTSASGEKKNRAEAKWSGSTISNMIQNEWYKGVRHYQGIEHTHEAIISKEDWSMAQSIRAERIKVFRSKRETNKHVYLLQNLLYCGICGKKMYGHYTGLNNHYYCSSMEYGNKCGLRGICKENIEACVYSCCTNNAYVSIMSGKVDEFSKFFQISKEDEKHRKEEIELSKQIIKEYEKNINGKNQEITNLINQQASTNNKDLQDRYMNSINQRYDDIDIYKEKIIKEQAKIRKNESLLRTSSDVRTSIKNLEKNKNLDSIKQFFQAVIEKVILFNTEIKNNIIRIVFRNGKVTEFIYSASAMPNKFFPLYEPLFYNERTNAIESHEYPVFFSDGIPFSVSQIEEYKGSASSSKRNYAKILVESKEDMTLLGNTKFSVNDYILYLKSLPSYRGLPSFTRLEEIDDLGKEQREHYKQWRKKYNTGKPTQEVYVLHNENYAEICLKRKHLYNRRYKIKKNKSLSENEKQIKLDEIKKQLDLLSVQVPFIDGYEGKRKKNRKL